MGKVWIIVTCLVLVSFLGGSFIYMSRPTLLANLVRTFIARDKYKVLYKIDHLVVAEEMRAFAGRQRWNKPSFERPWHFLSADSATFPRLFRELGASSVTIFDDRVKLEFGGPPLHFGIVVFRKGDEGSGLVKLADEVWFYSEDGRVPSR